MDESVSAARALLRRLGTFLDRFAGNRFAGCFGRRAQREGASRYLHGLLNDSERKSMQPMDARLPAPDPASYQRLQHHYACPVGDDEGVGPVAGRAAGPPRDPAG